MNMHPGTCFCGPRHRDGHRDIREVRSTFDRGLRVEAGAQHCSGDGYESEGAAEAEGGDVAAVREHAEADQGGKRRRVEEATRRGRRFAGRECLPFCSACAMFRNVHILETCGTEGHPFGNQLAWDPLLLRGTQ